MPAAANAPRCFVCESAIEPGEPFKLVQAYQRQRADRTLPGNQGSAGGVRIVQRGVHYSCELMAIGAAVADGAGDDAPELVVEGAEDEELTTREKLSRLMGTAIDLVDVLDDLL